jgi:hypothetical protein
MHLSRLKEIDLGSFNTHLGLCLGGGVAVILTAVGLSKELGPWLWAVLVLAVVGTIAGLLGLALDMWRAWRPVTSKEPRIFSGPTEPTGAREGDIWFASASAPNASGTSEAVRPTSTDRSNVDPAAQKANTEALADLLERGEHVKNSIVLSAGSGSLGFELRPFANWESEATTWIGDAAAYIEANLGASYAAQFWSDAGLQTRELEPSYRDLVNGERLTLYRQVDWRCQRLSQFIDELRRSASSSGGA